MEKLLNNFLIGCDPEFIAMSGGEIKKLDQVLNKDGEVGYDHGGWVAELRPKPALGTYALLRRMAKQIKNPGLWGKFTTWQPTFKAGAYYHSLGRTITLGGHVHVDLDPQEEKMIPQKIWSGKWDPDNAPIFEEVSLPTMQYTEPHKLRVAAMDTLTHYLEALDILPKISSEKRRSSGLYGSYGDIRVQTRPDGKRHTEYRTMCSWLFDPKVAFLCLTGIKLACVAPEETRETLQLSQVSYGTLQKYFETFQHKDSNARRAVEWVLKGKVNELQGHETADVTERWGGREGTVKL